MAEQVTFGTILKHGSTTVGNLLEVDFPEMKLELKDTTHHATASQTRTRRPVMADVGEVTARVQIDATGITNLPPLCDPDSAAITWSILYAAPLTKTVSFSGWLSSFKIDNAPSDGILEATIKITPTGVVTIAATGG